MAERISASSELILNTARRLARDEGWDAVSVRKIADQIHYKAPIVYEFFENKEALIAQVVVDGFKSLRHEVKRVWEKQKESELSLVPVSMAYWNFAVRNPEVYAAMNLSGSFKQKYVGIVQEVEGFCEEVSRMVEDWAAACGIKEIDSVEITEVLWAHLHGIVMLGLSEQLGSAKKVKKTINVSMLTLERGLKAKA